MRLTIARLAALGAMMIAVLAPAQVPAGAVSTPAGATYTPARAAYTPARATDTPARATTSLCTLPVPGERIVALARIPRAPWTAGHRGIDINATAQAPVVAPAGGTVEFAGVVVDRPVVTIRHRDGRRSSLEPVSATVDVGTTVAAGQEVGQVGPGYSHCEPHLCVHWGLREGSAYIDPLDCLEGFGPVVLLPLADL